MGCQKPPPSKSVRGPPRHTRSHPTHDVESTPALPRTPVALHRYSTSRKGAVGEEPDNEEHAGNNIANADVTGKDCWPMKKGPMPADAIDKCLQLGQRTLQAAMDIAKEIGKPTRDFVDERGRLHRHSDEEWAAKNTPPSKSVWGPPRHTRSHPTHDVESTPALPRTPVALRQSSTSQKGKQRQQVSDEIDSESDGAGAVGEEPDDEERAGNNIANADIAGKDCWPMKKGPMPADAIDKCLQLGQRTLQAVMDIAKEIGKPTRDVLVRAGLTVALSRKRNLYNTYSVWYRSKHAKPDNATKSAWQAENLTREEMMSLVPI
ncbi:hypothetical protein BV22DRAFT_1130381 [Leucogyrophana mollusca]|uniref:Uncharacterized protein n=1 Tax=Leucogyrophana mollusca TaxID=85980 RepID=A0ACB8BEX1_9AGAM|nr:hypothetical protein BV22DRAFT_1130381 [Leucogyrophana mollusca]